MSRIIFPLLLLASLSACNSSNKSETTAEAADSTSTVEATADSSANDSAETDAITSATSKPNEVTFHGVLTIQAQHLATASATMGGVIKSINLVVGQRVNRGQVLATVQNQEFISLQQTYLDCAAQTDFLGTEYLRQKALASAQAASEKKLQQAHADYLSMKSRRDAAATQLRLLGVSPTAIAKGGMHPYFHIVAPISGFVTELKANLGKYLNVGDAVCNIVNKNDLYLKLTAYEKDLNVLRIGRHVQFRVAGLGDDIFTATITAIGQDVNESTRSIDVMARVNRSDPRFRVGMFITARIEK